MTTRQVITRTRQAERQISREFNFNQEMIPALSGKDNYPQFLVDYRSHAWQSYNSLPIPSLTD